MSVTVRTVVILSGVALLPLGACGGSRSGPEDASPGDVGIGYDTQPQEDVTGAVTSVSAEDAGASRTANIAELLRGRVAGLQIIEQRSGGYRFRIRGIRGDEVPEPLFVVDDDQIPPGGLEDALAGLTRDDIKRVDVLKDVASTSIYGSRAVGGVIVITTTRR